MRVSAPPRPDVMSDAQFLLWSDDGTAQAILDLVRHIDQRRRLTREPHPDET